MTLEVLYQNVFATIVRVQSSTLKNAPADDLRATFLSQLDEVDQLLRQLAAGYAPEQLEAARFAVVAFADEAALRAPQIKIREFWLSQGRKSLSHQLFGETNSGEGFYKRLERMRSFGTLSAETIDVLEIFCLCLLLGFEGAMTDRKVVINELVRDIQQVRGKTPPLAFGTSNLAQRASQHRDRTGLWIHRIAMAAVGAILLVYAIAQWNLRSWTGGVKEEAQTLSQNQDRN